MSKECGSFNACFVEAESFFKVACLCDDKRWEEGTPWKYLYPMVVNLAFSAELYIKALMIFESNEEDFFEEEEEYVNPRARRDEEDLRPRRAKKTKVVPVQSGRGAKSSVVIYSPKSYNDAQPLVMQLIQHKHVIVKLDKVDKRVAQRILDFMSGAAYASDAQVTEVSKDSIYLFASNQTYIDQSDDMESDNGEVGYTIGDY